MKPVTRVSQTRRTDRRMPVREKPAVVVEMPLPKAQLGAVATGGGGQAPALRMRMMNAIPGADLKLLNDYGFDAALHAKLAAQVKSGKLTPAASIYEGKIEPPKPGQVQTLPPAGSAEEALLRERGERALKNNEVAVVVLAGGMATRFQPPGGDPSQPVVKGTVDVVDGQSFIGLKLADARRAAKKYGGAVPFCVMGSFGTMKGKNGLEQHLIDRGLMRDDIKLFSQSISLRVTPEGEVFGAGGKELPRESYTTPGHGDFFNAIRKSGVLDELLKSGVKTIMFSNVDNLGATVDPRIIGQFLIEKEKRGVAMMAETVERSDEDGKKTGTVVNADGLFRILEGFRIPDDVAENVELPELSINTFYFDAEKLKQDIPLDVHAVEKKVDGKKAIQFETVTCEATGSLDKDGKPLLPLSVLRVPREGAVGRFNDGRFYPVKTPEDLDRVRQLLEESPVYGKRTQAQALQRVDAEFEKRFDDGVGPLKSFASPGRINLIGEHVDYQGGLALPAAVHLGVLMTSQKRADREVVLHSLDLEEPVRFSLGSASIAGDTTWGRYAKAVALAFEERGVKLPGMQAVLASSLPPGSGMSSSSALCLALAKAFATHSDTTLSNNELVLLAQRAEHIVGVHCGNMDQAAIVNGKKDHAVLLDCRTLDTKQVPLSLGDYVFVVGNTKKARGLVDSAYNERRAQCEESVEKLSKLTGRKIETLRDVSLADLDKHGAALSPKLLQRARHVVEEIERVRRFADELAKGGDDLPARLGALLDESHRSLRDLFEVSCDELNAMVELSRAHGASQQGGPVAGSRMMGGGFGGCTLSLVRRDAVESFIADVGEKYRAQTGLEPEFYVVEPGDGVGEIAREDA